jgi:hypothetical protein
MVNRVAQGFTNTKLKTDGLSPVDRGYIARIEVPAAAAVVASNTAVLAAVTSTALQQVITAGITSPAYARNITATAGGTAADIKAIQVIIEGTNMDNEVITETLPAFTVDTAGTVAGTKAFRTVTKVTIPAHDGTGATTAIGFGEVLGIPYKLPHNTVLLAYHNNAREGTLPTVTTSATALESNTFDLNTALNGSKVDVYLVV